MILTAIGLVLVAALLHATWNLILGRSSDPLRTSARAVTAACAVALPVGAIAWIINGTPGLPIEALGLAGLSALAELAYFVFLSAAYRRGDLATVYARARGTAPLVAVAIGIAVLGERPEPIALVGIGLLLAGIVTVRMPGRGDPAIVPALLAGFSIATYSAIDRVGVRMGPTWLYAWVLWIAMALALQGWLVLLRLRDRAGAAASAPASSTPAEPAPAPDGWGRSSVAGLLMLGAYVLVLAALSIAPLATVSPLRESAVVLVALWTTWRERHAGISAAKIGGAAAIAAGVIALAFGR